MRARTFDLRAVDDDGAGEDDSQGDRRRKHAEERRAPLGHDSACLAALAVSILILIAFYRQY